METVIIPFLEVTGPDGQQFRVELSTDRLTIGRLEMFNDLAFEPDPQQLITRKAHCILERDAMGWFLAHNGGVNPTFVRRGADMEIVEGRVRLKNGDSVLLLGKITDRGELLYWELTLRDPLETRPAGQVPRLAVLEYDWIQARLFRIEGADREEISNLPPQEHKLIRYMDARNRANDYVPVFCTSEELITAIWGEEEYPHTQSDLVHLIHEVRRILEPTPREPRFLQTVRGLGYRLVTRPFRTEGRSHRSES